MTFSHDDIRDRLVDYLYGQLDGEARAAFQAHLDACTACRGEVGGAERARVVAREVVRRPLGDAVPERIRARAFEAARAAVVARPGAPAKAVAAAAPALASEGWFSRLRRRWTWTFPTFATVAAMAVFLLVRATIFREAKAPVSVDRARELASPAQPAPGAPPSPSAAAELPSADGYRHGVNDPALSAPRRNVEASREAAGKADAPAVATEPKGGGTRLHHRRFPAAVEVPHAGATLDELSSSAVSRGAGAAQPAPTAAPSRKAAPRKAALPDADEFAGAIEEERARAAPQRQFAAPPPPPAAAAPLDEDDVQAAPAAEKKSDKKSKLDTDKEPVAPLAAPETRSRNRADGAGPPPVDPALARASRAEILMNQRRWSEAITILDELLRRYPAHAGVPEWRRRLAAAQAALAADTGQFATPPR